jgi:hypothetical protein
VSNLVRIFIVALCALALWYLVVMLARGMEGRGTGSLGDTWSASIAANAGPPSSEIARGATG